MRPVQGGKQLGGRLRRLVASVGAAALGVVPLTAAGLLVATPAAAAGGSVGISHIDGTAPFNDSDAAGYDSSASNDIVRTNDYMTYRVSLSAEGTDMATPTITLTLPRGVEALNRNGEAQLPAFCTTGSITPATLDDPIAPLTSNTPAANDASVDALTATSWESLPTQTVVCEVPNVPVGAAQVFEFTAKVRAEVPNGAVLDPATVTVSTPGDEGIGNDLVPDTPDTPVTVSAASKWDLSINGAEVDPNTAFVKQGTVERCSLPSIPRYDPQGDGTTENQWCWIGGYPVTLSIPDGGRGGVPMAGGDFSYQIDVSPEAIWGEDVLAAAEAEGVTLPGGYLGTTSNVVYGSPDPNPFTKAVGTFVNSARDSGTMTFTQAAAGEPIQVQVSGADTTAHTVPYKANDPNRDLPMNGEYPASGYVYTQRVFVQVPLTELFKLQDVEGVDQRPDDDSYLRANMTVTVDEATLQFTPLSGDGVNVFSDAGETSNDYRTMPAVIQSVQTVANHWVSPVNDPTATAPALYSPGFPAWNGPAGPAGKDTGDGVASLGQTVISSIHLSGDNFTGTTSLICQSFDNTIVNLAPGDYSGSAIAMQTIPSDKYTAANVPDGAIPYSDGTVWIQGGMYNWGKPTQYASSTSGAGMVDRYGDFQVDYGVGTNADPSCSGVTWYEDYEAVPDPTQITHVRVFIQNDGAQNALAQRTDIAIPFTVVGGEPGDLIPTWTSHSQAPGAHSYEDMLAQFPEPTVVSGFDPELNNDDNGGAVGRRGDVLTLVGASVRLEKAVEVPADGTYSANMNRIPSSRLWQTTANTVVPAYAPGDTGSYQLTPSIIANPIPAEGVDLLVEDCLPSALSLANTDPRLMLPTYSAIWENVGLLPVTPSIACEPGEFYMAWEIADQVVTETTTTLDPIIIPFEVIGTASPTNDLLNEAVVSSPVDFSNVDLRTDRAILDIEAPSGLRLSKVARPNLVTVDPNGWSSTPTVTWEVVLNALNNTTAVSDFEVIDLLPVDGLGGSSFHGSGDFVEASVTAENSVTGRVPVLLYTASPAPTQDADIAEWTDPTSALNGADGANVWCTAVGGTRVSGSGTDADCPAAPADVTGLRVLLPGAFGQNETVTLSVTTDATHNQGGAEDEEIGDTMENTVQGTATGLDVPMIADSTVAFVNQQYEFNTGVISGNAWDDIDADGIWDEGEPVIPGVVVTLTAVDPDTGEVFTDPNTEQPLYDPANPPTTTVAEDGTYQFTGLFANIPYTVTFTTPEGYEPTIAGTDSVAPETTVTLTIPDTQYTEGVDAGYIKPGTLAVAKTVVDAAGEPVAAAVPGQELTYTVTVTNTSADRAFTAARPAAIVDSLADVLDDATLVDDPAADAGTAAVEGTTLLWAGPLAPGETATITYTVLVTANSSGDDLATNVALTVPAGPIDPDTGLPPHEGGVPTDQDGNPVTPTDPDTGEIIPPAECVEPGCASTTTPVLSKPEVAKTVTIDGEPATLAGVGDTLTYSLTIVNNGAADYTAEHPAVVVDDLTDVLAVAEVTGAEATAGTVTAGDPYLVWTGPLAVGESVTVTYTVLVTDTGDLDAVNVAFSTYGGTTDPDTGLPEDPGTGETVTTPSPDECLEPTCVTTTTPIRPVPDLAIAKTDTVTRDGQTVPAETVRPGEVVTYTVTIENTSADAAFDGDYPATFVDDLSDVLDDGELTGAPTASTGTVTTVGERLVWTGSLAAGESATVTYQVTMGSDGDQNVRNVAFVAPPGTLDPDSGQPVDPGTGDPIPTPTVCTAPVCATTEATVELPVTPPVTPPTTPPAKPMPATGADVTSTLAGAGLLLLGGLVALEARRRRTA